VEGCWNWFDPSTAAGYGEAAIVLAQIAEIRKQYRVQKKQIYVAGMSSGAALAAVLAVRHPERFRGVAIHSGVPCGAATSAWTAQHALRSGPSTAVERIALAENARAPRGALPLPALIIHGDQDARVDAQNANRLVSQFLALNGDQRGLDGAGLPAPDEQRHFLDTGQNSLCDLSTYRHGGRTVVQYLTVPGLDHAWSGGDSAYVFNSSRGPDATSVVLDFLLDGADSVRSSLRSGTGSAMPALSPPVEP